MNSQHPWPDDEDGEVLTALLEDGLDFDSEHDIDFNVEFESWPPPAEAMNWLASRFESVELIEPDDDFDGYVLVQVRARPSYDLIVQVQREVSQALSAHGGICDSWGILH